jgi:hypothetical protein
MWPEKTVAVNRLYMRHGKHIQKAAYDINFTNLLYSGNGRSTLKKNEI